MVAEDKQSLEKSQQLVDCIVTNGVKIEEPDSQIESKPSSEESGTSNSHPPIIVLFLGIIFLCSLLSIAAMHETKYRYQDLVEHR